MAYSHFRQFRSSIIRGKAKTDLENLLPAYANIIEEVCPCKPEDFVFSFNSKLQKITPEADGKTLDNHRTEIAGKLFGMYFEENGYIYSSERTQKYLADNDQPAFFKDMCFKFQFPNGLDKADKLLEKIEVGVKIRPLCLVLGLMIEADKQKMALCKREISYYALNSLDALRGDASYAEIVEQIKSDREENIERRVNNPGKAESYNTQHIREQLNYLELANLIRIRGDNLFINNEELELIRRFSEATYVLGFNVYSYTLDSVEQRRDFYEDWQHYYAMLDTTITDLASTSVDALQFDVDDKGVQLAKRTTIDTTALGDDGEMLVYQYEKERVAEYDQRLTNKINMLGKTKGLGYDVQSIFAAESDDDPEFVKYIEVKSTKRVTKPSMDSTTWLDTLNLTRNEWVAAAQHGKSYEIYRVYFTQEGSHIYIIRNPHSKNEEKLIRAIPTHYRLDFGSNAVDKVVAR